MEMFLSVFMQAVILAILMLLGLLLGKTKTIGDQGAKSLTELVMLFATPCVIIKSFIREFSVEILKKLLISFVIAIAVHLLFIALSVILVRSKNLTSKKMLQFSVIFTNAGFMGLPLQMAILGDDGVFYCSAYITIFQIFLWTYGVYLTSGNKKDLTVKKLVFNPGIIGFVIGVLIFVLSIPVPNVIKQPIEYMAALNTPLPMIVIGYHLSKSNVIKYVKNLKCLLAVSLRVIAFPLIALAIMYLCGIRGTMFVSTVISACAPTGALATVFAAKYNSDVELSVAMVSLTTIISIITMPLIITLAQLVS